MNKTESKCYAPIFICLLLVFTIGTGIQLFSDKLKNVPVNNDWDSYGENALDTEIINHFFLRSRFIDLNGGIRTVLGQREMNTVVKQNNGYLAMTATEGNEMAYEICAENLLAFQTALEKKGIRFLYVCGTDNVPAGSTMLPAGLSDYQTENTDRFLQMLEDRNISFLDTRKSFSEANRDPYSLIFRTDHHWTMEAGFLAAGEIETALESLLDTKTDPGVRDLKNFHIAYYPDCFLGSYGQRTGALFDGTDGFQILWPKEQPEIISHITGTGGSWEEMLLDRSYLTDPAENKSYTYDLVFHNVPGWFSNEASSSDKRILICCDSYGKTVIPFLLTAFREVRYVENSMLLNDELLDSYAPDVVILLYSPYYNLGYQSRFTFGIQ